MPMRLIGSKRAERKLHARRPRAVAEKVYVDINGLPHGMFIQGADSGLPVLLYLHGGMPEYFLTERYPTGLEDNFTVAWWEQRGTGLSYSPDIPPAAKTSEQFIADTLAVTNYLRNRFRKQKIYLMAHSGGTFVGLQSAASAPELYSAYVGVAQAVAQLESERLAYEYMLEQYKQRGDHRMVRKLEAAPVTSAAGTPGAYLAVRDRAMHRLGVGTTRDMKSVVSGVFWPSLRSPQYSPSEKLRMWLGKAASGVSVLWGEMLATNLAERVTRLEVPAYFFHGIHDYTVSYQLAKTYVEGLDAPLKGFYTFSKSAHSPIFEEPEKCMRIMRDDVLAGTNSHADSGE
ncbi:MAG TPA: alpha/beta hydrolase [Streptosporangiaceae bacterium]|jgi:pimeloyl-ACP methyl ester carboxylesterase|nr:alpha/beta hydrolase [Streptosporangiaceae bacterium]